MLSPAAHWRSAAADTFALVVYCFIAGMAIEVSISGMSFQQSLSSRLLSIPVNILIAGLTAAIAICLSARRAAVRAASSCCATSPTCWPTSASIAGLCRHSVERRRRRPTNAGGGHQQCAGLHGDGRGVWLFPGILPAAVPGGGLRLNQEPGKAGSCRADYLRLRLPRRNRLRRIRVKPGLGLRGSSSWPTPAPTRVRLRHDGAEPPRAPGTRGNPTVHDRRRWRSPDRSASGRIASASRPSRPAIKRTTW